MIDGASDATLVSYQMLSYADGTIYLNTNLGAIAALDAMDGELKWLVRYPRNQVDDAAYPESQRFRYRDLTPCLIEKDVIYCAPADRPEIFALDASTGDLLWSTIPEHSADVVHLLSAGDGTLVTAGDRVVWFDTASGRSLASFPSGVAAKPSEGVAEPRGLGRPWCTQDWIYFPSRNQISVLSRKLDRSKTGAQAIVSRDPILLASRASEGGNLVLAERWLLLATPSRLVAFASPDIPKE
jgi:outer membrane protein assembly factor BamB